MILPLFLLLCQSSVQEMVKVEYVLLDVQAVHRDGSPVRDLKTEDFVVKENKKKVPFTLVEVLDFQADSKIQAEGTVPVNKEIAPDATASRKVYQMIFALDLQIATPRIKQQIVSQIDAFLNDLSARPANVAIQIYSMEKGRITDGFTTDPGEASEAIQAYLHKELERGAHSRMEDLTSRFGDLENNFRLCQRHYAASSNRRRDARWEKELQDCITQELEAFADQEEDDLMRTIRELEDLTRVFADRPGPKFIYYVSPGFSLRPGHAATQMAKSFVPHATAVGRTANFQKEFRRIHHACIRNRVVFNTFDIVNAMLDRNRKLDAAYSNINDTIWRHWKQYQVSLDKGLTTLAVDSGGNSYRGLNMAPAMMDTFTATRHIYVLGYQAPKGRKGKYRKIKVTCKRRNVTLHHRKGYFGL